MTTIKEQLAGRQYGEVITRLENVIVKALFDRKEGTGEYGAWSLQNGYLTDGETEIRVCFGNVPDAKFLEGKTISLLATETKHGFKGVKLVKNEYNGEVNPEIRVTKAGFVDLEGTRVLYG